MNRYFLLYGDATNIYNFSFPFHPVDDRTTDSPQVTTAIGTGISVAQRLFYCHWFCSLADSLNFNFSLHIEYFLMPLHGYLNGELLSGYIFSCKVLSQGTTGLYSG